MAGIRFDLSGLQTHPVIGAAATHREDRWATAPATIAFGNRCAPCDYTESEGYPTAVAEAGFAGVAPTPSWRSCVLAFCFWRPSVAFYILAFHVAFQNAVPECQAFCGVPACHPGMPCVLAFPAGLATRRHHKTFLLLLASFLCCPGC